MLGAVGAERGRNEYADHPCLPEGVESLLIALEYWRMHRSGPEDFDGSWERAYFFFNTHANALKFMVMLQ